MYLGGAINVFVEAWLRNIAECDLYIVAYFNDGLVLSLFLPETASPRARE
jgi:hypothetical protein